MAKTKKKGSNDGGYTNPLGNLTDDELKELRMKPYDELVNYLKTFKIVNEKCPPARKCICVQFRCAKCYAQAIGKEFHDKLFKGFESWYDKCDNDEKEKNTERKKKLAEGIEKEKKEVKTKKSKKSGE